MRPNVIKSGLSKNIEAKLESKMHNLDLVESKNCVFKIINITFKINTYSNLLRKSKSPMTFLENIKTSLVAQTSSPAQHNKYIYSKILNNEDLNSMDLHF